MAYESLEDFYAFWKSLEDPNATGESRITPFITVYPSAGHLLLCLPTFAPFSLHGGIGKSFDIQDFDNLSYIAQNSQHCMSEDKIQSTIDQMIVSTQETKSAEELLQFILSIHSFINDDLYNKHLSTVEELLYNSKFNTVINEHYVASRKIQLVFHIRRIHARFLEKDFQIAEKILNELALQWMNIDQCDSINIIYQHFVFFLCTNKWETAIINLKKMWNHISLLNSNERFNFGAWDNWIVSVVIIWFFALHSIDFNTLFSDKFNLFKGCLLRNRKVLLTQTLNPKQIQSLLPGGYYNHACSLNNCLPCA